MNRYIDTIKKEPLYGETIHYASMEYGIISDMTILDIGCGEGKMSLFFAMHDANVIGIDKRSSALKQANELLKTHSLEKQCLFIKGFGEKIPLPDASVDIIYSRSTIQYMDRPTALEEYFRVLRPEGKVILIENLPHNPIIYVYRIVRRLTSWSEKKKSYINSIRGYITHSEISDYSNRFEKAYRKEFHLFRMISIYSSRRLAFIRHIDTLVGSLDTLLLKYIPGLKRLAWFCLIYCERKKADV